MQPSLIIQQPGSSAAEARAVTHAALLADIRLVVAPVADLARHREALAKGQALPQGSVKYVREAMRVGGIREPQFSGYPRVLEAFFERKIWQGTKADLARAREPVFVKPVKTKLFTGFVPPAGASAQSLDEHDQEQWQALQALAEDEPLWFSEPVRFLSETRFYVVSGRVLGGARYDPLGADDAPCVPAEIAQRAADAWQEQGDAPAAYALDFGVLVDGRFALVEANDGWALGLYGKALSPRQYLEFLSARWRQIWAPCAQ
jgi:hypothetical protein